MATANDVHFVASGAERRVTVSTAALAGVPAGRPESLHLVLNTRHGDGRWSSNFRYRQDLMITITTTIAGSRVKEKAR
ncbi:MAG: hypothetical protein OXL68_00840 [Paracoccaceae bacterium]|nr:hypothetical protein [Paracoccaceae bacterium]